MSKNRDGVWRSAIIAVVGGALFAAFVLITPRLAVSTDSEPTLGPMIAATQMTRIVETASTASDTAEAPAATETEPVPTTTTTTTTTHPTTTTTTSTTQPRPQEGGLQDGTVSLQAEILPEKDGKAGEVLRDGDQVTWRFTVTAEKAELWGVFLYLELHGHIPCPTKHLHQGESTQCEATTTVYEGDFVDEAWVDAWTLDHMVTDIVHPRYTVAPRS